MKHKMYDTKDKLKAQLDQMYNDRLNWIEDQVERRTENLTQKIQEETEKAKGKTEECGRAYFETEHRRFVIIDAPGHKSYVHHMIGGAAQADLGADRAQRSDRADPA